MDRQKNNPKFRSTILTRRSIAEAVKVEAAAFNMLGESYYSLYIVCRAGRIIGFKDNQNQIVAVKEILRDSNENMYCYGTAVLPRYQRMGLGTLMSGLWEKEAFRQKTKWLFTFVSPQNGANLNSYINKTGFAAVGFIKEAFGEKGDYGYGLDHFLLAKKVGKYRLTDTQAMAEKLRRGSIPFLKSYCHDSVARAAVCEDNYTLIRKLIDDGMEMVALVRKSQLDSAFSCRNNIFIFQKKRGARFVLPGKDFRCGPGGRDGFEYIDTSEGCDEALAIERKYLGDATIYHLRSIGVLQGLLGMRISDKMAGFFGYLLPLAKRNGLYFHGPFADPLCKTKIDFSKKSLKFAESIAFGKKISKIWTIVPVRRNDAEQGLFQFFCDNHFTVERVEKPMFSNSGGLIISKNIG